MSYVEPIIIENGVTYSIPIDGQSYNFFHTSDSNHPALLKELASVMKDYLAENIRKVVFYSPHSVSTERVNMERVMEDGRLNIFCWTNAEPTRKVEIPRTMFGLTRTSDYCGDDMFIPSGHGEPVFLPDGDVAIAEYYRDYGALCIFFDIFHRATYDYKTLLRGIMEQFSPMLGELTEEQKDAIEKRRQEKERLEAERKKKEQEEQERIMRELAHARKLAFVRSYADNKEDNLKRELDSVRANIRDYRGYLVKALDKEQGMVAELAGLEKLTGTKLKKAMAEFDMLTQQRGIVGYEFKDSTNSSLPRLVLETDDIYATTVQGDRYYMGKFSVSVLRETAEVVFTNTNNKRRGFWTGGLNHHPHVDNHGNPCWGNASSMVMELVQQNEWCALANILIGYLESVNLDDCAGEFVVNWDKVDEDGNVIEEGHDTRNPGGEDDVQCSGCEEYYDADEVETCTHCNASLCPDCRTWLDSAEAYVCDACRNEFYTYCNDCEEYVHDDHMVKCAHCKTKVCDSCAAESDNDDYYCSDCWNNKVSSCNNCDAVVPNDDLSTCEVCGDEICENCAHEGAFCSSTCYDSRETEDEDEDEDEDEEVEEEDAC